MKATTKKKRQKKAPARGFMCGCGGAKSVSTVSRAAVSICAVTTTPMKATTSTAAPALKPASPSAAKTAAAVAGRRDADAANAEGSPSVDSLLRQLRELERGVRALGVREREDGGGGGDGSEPGATRPRRHGRSASDWGVGRLESESVAVVTESEDPLGDFRRSMVQMIVENGITGGAELRGLLQRFLSLNAACHHHLILRAFADVWEELFAGGGHAHAHAPAPAPPLPGAEKISSSYSYSSIASSSKRRPHAQPAAGADTLTRSRPVS